jgi:hypothetical protein
MPVISPITRGEIFMSIPPQVFENKDGTRTYVYYDRQGPVRSEIRDKTGRFISTPERGGDFDVPGGYRRD